MVTIYRTDKKGDITLDMVILPFPPFAAPPIVMPVCNRIGEF
jgi:hypothetical protein